MIPPHNIDAERAVLGALLLHAENVHAVQVDCRLNPGDFYRPQYGVVYESILRLHDEKRAIDEITISVDLKEHEQDAPSDLEELSAWAPAAGNVRDYARIVKDLAVRRRVLRAAQQTEEEARAPKGDVRNLLERAERRMLAIEDVQAGHLEKLDAGEELDRLARVHTGEQGLPGVESGLVDVDNLTGGWQPDNLVVVAARPGMGKSAFVVNVAQHAAENDLPVAIFSLEMSRQEILRRIVANVARVPGEALTRGPLSAKQYEKALAGIEKVLKWPLFVDESPDLSVTEARAKARRLHSRHPLGLIVVDYVQLMRTEGNENRTVEVGNITRGLKVLAKELHVPVLGVSQLSRAVEQRGDKRPQLSDLRDSGSVEQDADLVLFLYRGHYYHPDEIDDGEAEVNVAKQRNGPVGRVKLTFLGHYPRFTNWVDPMQFADYAPAAPKDDEMPF